MVWDERASIRWKYGAHVNASRGAGVIAQASRRTRDCVRNNSLAPQFSSLNLPRAGQVPAGLEVMAQLSRREDLAAALMCWVCTPRFIAFYRLWVANS